MKRNLLKGIILISAIALSSCSTMNSLSKTGDAGDDVYYTKAKAGDSFDFNQQYIQPQNDYVRNDDYYYYGDYESRINRFSYFTPFDYDDDFYYSYVPYNTYPNMAYQTNNQVINQPAEYYYEPVYGDLGVYSAYDFGYGDFGGYDNYGYGVAYSTFIYGGGSRATHKRSYTYSNKANAGNGPGAFVRTNSSNRNGFGGVSINNDGTVRHAAPGLIFTRANTGRGNSSTPGFSGSRPGGYNAVYPGRPGTNAVTQVSTNNGNTPVIRPQSQNPRPVIQQPAIERVSAPSQSSSSGSSGSSGSSNSSGGGGRPVRP
ncbi:hypothetical protein [Mucilaginibacter sp. UR6-11]|uniref:hypothetical protein n=1 Tax=Mucilaginibacter sp. UR6-11 TaxID=1435644 RepID=UPI001E38C28C|nr:hypothetical protein [Mucilaginibacter sp. UR6-11]MCC8426167.1 hypothetical protein [Mucilaginibacter sp. UR6-11]